MTAIPILLYHSISDDPSSWIAPFTVTPEAFRRHLEVLRSSGRTPLTVDQLRRGLAGRTPMPPRAVVVTFDDGYLDNLDHAVPMLAAEDLVATFYITTGFVQAASPGGDPMLSWDGVGQLQAAGHQIGAHTVHHPQLDTLPPAEASAEIRGSRYELEDHLGVPIKSFAYPHGYASAAVRRLVGQAGFDSACGVRNALSHETDTPYQLARLTITPDTTTTRLDQWLAGTGAALAAPAEQLRTKVWRAYRRGRANARRLADGAGNERVAADGEARR